LPALSVLTAIATSNYTDLRSVAWEV
jgi:hypothetical protein